jgi:hypothetical protein
MHPYFMFFSSLFVWWTIPKKTDKSSVNPFGSILWLRIKQWLVRQMWLYKLQERKRQLLELFFPQNHGGRVAAATCVHAYARAFSYYGTVDPCTTCNSYYNILQSNNYFAALAYFISMSK